MKPAGRVYYTSDEPTPLEQHLYAIGLDGRDKRRLSQEPGFNHAISMGPGGLYYLDTWSSLSEPAAHHTPCGRRHRTRRLSRADRSALKEYDILPTEIVPFNTPDGATLYGRLIKPAGYERGKRYPVIVSVYGGPGVGLPVHNTWLGINIDQVLAHRGYVVWQCENRGGEGRGHAFETAIYHKLGVIELADQVAGVQHLISWACRPGAHRHPRVELWRIHDAQRPS